MFIGSREIIMPRGWVVEYNNGSVYCEDDIRWTKLPNKRDIKRVILKWEDRFWELVGKENYTVPTKKGFIDSAGGQGIHSRTIGYYDTENNCKVILRVLEDTGRLTWEQEPF